MGNARLQLGDHYNAGILQGLGNSTASLWLLGISCGVNILLDLVFVAGPGMGVAGCAVAGKVNGVADIAITSFSGAATVFAGQNLGAGNYRRLRRGAWQIPLVSGVITLAVGLLVTIWCRPLLALFTPDPAVLVFAQRYVRIVLPFTWNYAVFNGIMNFVNGIGEIRYPTVVNLLLLWAVRIPAAYALAWLGYGGYAMAGVSLSFFVGMAAMLLYFRTARWADICRKADAEPLPSA